jgi:flagellar basal-body rod protein FlgG
MLHGMHSAAAGMVAQQQRMDALANDLSNASTPGYKHLRTGFRDLVYAAAGPTAGTTVRAGAGAAASEVGRGFAQGALQRTDAPLDLAIEGPGFFRVRREDGTQALTRDGSFRADARGRLVTSRGELLQPAITLPAGTSVADVEIAGNGSVSVAGRALGQIAVVDVPAPHGLQSLGDNLFATGAASGAPRPVARATLAQGTLEASNVDVADAMVELMDAQRTFQLASKAVQMQDQMMEIANGVKR